MNKKKAPLYVCTLNGSRFSQGFILSSALFANNQVHKENSSLVQCLEDEECGSLKLKQMMSLLEHELNQSNQVDKETDSIKNLSMVVREPSRLWTVVPGVLIGCNSGQKSNEMAEIIAAV
ncbi:uncharacterized protein [Asterias amurensis]|uniref:uncharacterized protein n=1 Tax=Asterias amurensis TaxID=7602 RepID=UPI003AB84572